ncbi:unnamed protein product [Diabrotica balteata]|uniref:Rab11-FIP3/4 domain-containing protein n=1 Tax=Diabrotica balteata TaxID=107213 RepID=A0A9N9X6F9_DIABA|nr:unnamed protein product [Diabrotica balteata]
MKQERLKFDLYFKAGDLETGTLNKLPNYQNHFTSQNRSTNFRPERNVFRPNRIPNDRLPRPQPMSIASRNILNSNARSNSNKYDNYRRNDFPRRSPDTIAEELYTNNYQNENNNPREPQHEQVNSYFRNSEYDLPQNRQGDQNFQIEASERKQLQASETECANLKKEVNRQKDEIDKYKNERQNLTHQVSDLTSEVTSVKEEMKMLKNQEIMLKREYKAQVQHSEDLSKEIGRLRLETRTLNKVANLNIYV